MKRALYILLASLILSACTAGGAQNSQSMRINEAWARPGMSGGNTAVYFIIENPSVGSDRLLGAACDAAKMVEVHMTSTDAQGNSKMEHQEAVEIPAGETIRFEPGGLHVMLMNLNEDLQPGQRLAVTLQFEKTGDVQVEAAVREP